MSRGPLEPTCVAGRGADTDNFRGLVYVEVALTLGILVFLGAHSVGTLRGLTMQQARAAARNLIQPFYNAQMSEQMSKQRRKMAAYLTGPMVEGLCLLILCSTPLRITSLLAVGVGPAPTPVYLVAATLAVTGVLYKRKLETHATIVVKGAMLFLCFVTTSVRLRGGSDGDVMLSGTVRVGAVLFASPVESFLFNIYITLVNIVETQLAKDVTVASSMRLCAREIVWLVAVLILTRRIVELQATAAEQTLNAKELRRTSAAATNLVKSRTDAVLRLDASLRVVEPDWQLAAMLGADVAALGGTSFETFLPLDDDRERFQSMCKLATEDEQDDEAHVVDMIHASVQNSCRSVTFGTRLFHVPIHVSGRRGHLIGICRTSRREPQSMPEAQEAPPADRARTLELPARLDGFRRSLEVPAQQVRSACSSRSSCSARSARAASARGGGGARALVSATSAGSDFLSVAEAEAEAFRDFW